MIYPLLWKIRTSILALIGARTVGARALVIKDNKVLLVKHTYNTGWYTIGGGVEKGESTLSAIKRELKEEVGLVTDKNPVLFAIYHNAREKRDDHVALYICKDFNLTPAYSPEIAAMEWFDFTNLPQDISPATKRRIEEYLSLSPITDQW